MNIQRTTIVSLHKSNISRLMSLVSNPPKDVNLLHSSKSAIKSTRRLAKKGRKILLPNSSKHETQMLYGKMNEARNLITKFNALDVNDQTAKQKILYKLLNPACRARQRLPLIESPFLLQFGYNLTVGHNFFANYECVFQDRSPIKIGDNCLLGPGVHIYTGSYSLDVKLRKKYMITYPVKIGNNVWIGGSSVVCPGVTIGDNVVVAAGSIVVRDIPSNVLIGGNPAKIIRHLDIGYNEMNEWSNFVDQLVWPF